MPRGGPPRPSLREALRQRSVYLPAVQRRGRAMRSNRIWKAVLVLSLTVTAAVTLVSVAGASQLQSSATSALPESNVIDPLGRRGEEAPADRSNSELHGKSKTHNGVATPVVSPTAVAPGSNAMAGQG